MNSETSFREKTVPDVMLHQESDTLAAWLAWLGAVMAILVALERGYEGSWYPLGTIMHHPEAASAAFGYRLLFPFIAVQLQRLRPSLSDHNSFVAVQTAIIAATVYLSGKWASLFLPRLGRILGYLLLPLMICPTIGYWTFYDIAIVGFWTACFLLLHRGNYGAYLLVLGLATLNHENILLIIPCAVLYLWGRMKLPRLIIFAISQVAVWCAVRYLATSLVHGAALFDKRWHDNLFFWRYYSLHQLAFAGLTLLPWWLLAFMGWKYAPRLLRFSALSLPGLIVVTLLFGKLNEVRQFAAFVPTCIGLICCWFGSRIGSPAADAGS
jgi:hypothetical protein